MGKRRTKMTAEQRRDRAKKLQESIADQVAALASSDEWRRFLKFAQAFHAYSLNNVMLILGQRPDATKVAGFRRWQELGRQVRKGERGIKIFGYAQKRVADENDRDDNGDPVEKVVTYYPVLTVFDISQTDPIEGAEPPPEIARKLDGVAPAGLYDAAAAWLYAQGWKVEREPIEGDANGYTKMDGSRRVVIDASLSDAQATKTLLHEAAHVILHADEGAKEYVTHRGVKETEAESVAYVVAGMHGLDTSAYTIGYVAGWSSADVEMIRATADRVLTAAATLAEGIETTEYAQLAAA